MDTNITALDLRMRIRKLALSLLDDENGIGTKGYLALREQMRETGNEDLLDLVEASDGRFYMGEDAAEWHLARVESAVGVKSRGAHELEHLVRYYANLAKMHTGAPLFNLDTPWSELGFDRGDLLSLSVDLQHDLDTAVSLRPDETPRDTVARLVAL